MNDLLTTNQDLAARTKEERSDMYGLWTEEERRDMHGPKTEEE